MTVSTSMSPRADAKQVQPVGVMEAAGNRLPPTDAAARICGSAGGNDAFPQLSLPPPTWPRIYPGL